MSHEEDSMEEFVQELTRSQGDLFYFIRALCGDVHAAAERLACNTYFGADLPDGGGLPQLTPQLAAARTRQRKASVIERRINVCPTCSMAIPATGVCDNCD